MKGVDGQSPPPQKKMKKLLATDSVELSGSSPTSQRLNTTFDSVDGHSHYRRAGHTVANDERWFCAVMILDRNGITISQAPGGSVSVNVYIDRTGPTIDMTQS